MRADRQPDGQAENIMPVAITVIDNEGEQERKVIAVHHKLPQHLKRKEAQHSVKESVGLATGLSVVKAMKPFLLLCIATLFI